jgi:hypothetical protein
MLPVESLWVERQGRTIIIKANESPHGKPRGIFKGKIHFIAASCGELNPKRD